MKRTSNSGSLAAGKAKSNPMGCARRQARLGQRGHAGCGHRAALGYFTGSIFFTSITPVFSYSVPVTFTLCAAKFPGVCWSDRT